MTRTWTESAVAEMIPSRRFVLIALTFICASVMTVTFFGVAQTRCSKPGPGTSSTTCSPASA